MALFFILSKHCVGQSTSSKKSIEIGSCRSYGDGGLVGFCFVLYIGHIYLCLLPLTFITTIGIYMVIAQIWQLLECGKGFNGRMMKFAQLNSCMNKILSHNNSSLPVEVILEKESGTFNIWWVMNLKQNKPKIKAHLNWSFKTFHIRFNLCLFCWKLPSPDSLTLLSNKLAIQACQGRSGFSRNFYHNTR